MIPFFGDVDDDCEVAVMTRFRESSCMEIDEVIDLSFILSCPRLSRLYIYNYLFEVYIRLVRTKRPNFAVEFS